MGGMKQRFEVGIPTCTFFLSAPSLQSPHRAGFSVSISKREYGGPYFPRVYQPRLFNSGVRCGFLFGHQTVCCCWLASVLEERIVVSHPVFKNDRDPLVGLVDPQGYRLTLRG